MRKPTATIKLIPIRRKIALIILSRQNCAAVAGPIMTVVRTEYDLCHENIWLQPQSLRPNPYTEGNKRNHRDGTEGHQHSRKNRRKQTLHGKTQPDCIV